MPIDRQSEIKNEISIALERLGADPRLLAVVGSWGALSDAEVLTLLRDWNAGRVEWLSIARTGARRRPKFRIVRPQSEPGSRT
jgi:hypothetical protein